MIKYGIIEKMDLNKAQWKSKTNKVDTDGQGFDDDDDLCYIHPLFAKIIMFVLQMLRFVLLVELSELFGIFLFCCMDSL